MGVLLRDDLQKEVKTTFQSSPKQQLVSAYLHRILVNQAFDDVFRAVCRGVYTVLDDAFDIMTLVDELSAMELNEAMFRAFPGSLMMALTGSMSLNLPQESGFSWLGREQTSQRRHESMLLINSKFFCRFALRKGICTLVDSKKWLPKHINLRQEARELEKRQLKFAQKSAIKLATAEQKSQTLAAKKARKQKSCDNALADAIVKSSPIRLPSGRMISPGLLVLDCFFRLLVQICPIHHFFVSTSYRCLFSDLRAFGGRCSDLFGRYQQREMRSDGVSQQPHGGAVQAAAPFAVATVRPWTVV